jgi:peptidoglycan/xylan/chitin deacetylase (PgdA/CDA1 family)
MFYFVKTPWLLKKWYSGCIWNFPTDKKIIFLTFDDGPHILSTPFILDELKKYQAKGTFFCIGKNVSEQPQLYRRILEEGHRVGNHTQDHLNGWKTADKKYFQNIQRATSFIDSDLFRPPYGRITRFQVENLTSNPLNFRIIMWDVLSADFDKKIALNKCSENVIRYARPGSIVVFHDSQKAFDKMTFALPKVLQHFSEEGYIFESIK